jgi:hypothetical protein
MIMMSMAVQKEDLLSFREIRQNAFSIIIEDQYTLL